MLAVKNKDLRTLTRAVSAALPRLPLKCTASTQARTNSTGTVFIKQHQSKPAVHTNVTGHKKDKTVKKGPVSVSSQAQSLHRSSMNARTSIKADLQKRLLVSGLEKTAHKSQVDCRATYKRVANTVQIRADTKKQDAVTLRTAKVTDLKKPLNRCPPAKPDGSGKTQTGSQGTQVSNKLRSKQEPTRTQRSVPVPARQRSSLTTAFTKTENALKSTSVPASSVTKAAPQQRRATFKPPSKPTVQAPGPQTHPRPTKTRSGLTSGTVQPKTPKSTFNPGNNGVRTVPLDARNKPTTAQEERL